MFIQQLRRRLAIEFYEKLFVDRPETQETEALLAHRQFVVVKGDRGSGKTTIMRKLARDFQDSTTRSIHYLDLRQYAGQLAHSEKPAHAVSEIIFHHLWGCLFGERQHADRRLRWTVFRAWNDPSCQDLREEIQLVEKLGNPYEDEAAERDWIEALRSKAYHERLSTRSIPGTQNLIMILRFLQEHCNHHCVLLIDDIDRYPLQLQGELVSLSLDLTALKSRPATPVIAVRSEGHRELAEGTSDQPFFVQRLRALRDVPTVALRAEDSLLESFIRRRLDFVRSMDSTDLFGPADLKTLTERLGFQSGLEFVESHVAAYSWISKEISNADVVNNFARWHNNSLRSTASHVFNLLSAFTTGDEPLFRYEDVVPSAWPSDSRPVQPWLPSVRSVRTIAFRHILFGLRRPPEEPQPPIFLNDTESFSTQRPLAFPLLKALEYLRSRPDSRCHYDQFIQDFGSLGVTRERLFDTLDIAQSSRGFDIPGLINVERYPEDVAPNMPGATVIELLPAGRFLLEQLSTSCEYIFWAAAYSEVDDQLYWRVFLSNDLNVRNLLSDEFRLGVAARYLSLVIVPRFREEIAWLGGRRDIDAAEEFQRYRQLFGYAQHGLYPERAASSLGRFAVSAGVRPQAATRILAELDQVRFECASLQEQPWSV